MRIELSGAMRGCSCDTCERLRAELKARADAGAAELWETWGPPPPSQGVGVPGVYRWDWPKAARPTDDPSTLTVIRAQMDPTKPPDNPGRNLWVNERTGVQWVWNTERRCWEVDDPHPVDDLNAKLREANLELATRNQKLEAELRTLRGRLGIQEV